MSRQVIANRFVIEEMLGEGGMGVVYRGTDKQTGERVAIKALKPEVITRDAGIVARFTREGEALRRLNHPNIVKVLANVDENNRHYIMMELVEGGSLEDLMRSTDKLPYRRIMSIALELADALTRAHHLRIIHRDIKPANVLLAQDSTPRLTDFGVAHIGDEVGFTQAGVTIGTFAYLSPEACRGEIVDVRTDIWSFGVMLYEMVAGRRPFIDKNPGALVAAIMTKPVPEIEQFRPDVPVELVDLIYRMLEKNREARIPRMRMVGAELEAIIEGGSTFSSFTPGRFALSRTQPLIGFNEAELTVTDTPAPDSSTFATPAPLHNLPAFTTPFVGRENELNELNALLQKADARLITVLGPGGIGKTRVAVGAAEALASQFKNGVAYVPLAALSEATHIVPTIAEHLQFTFAGAEEPKMQILNFLREKEMLLVLDNFEHLIEAAGILNEILQTAPAVKVLVVSRERLRLQGERPFEIGELPLPSLSESLATEELAQFAAVTLFIQSAQRVQPDFALTPENALYVVRICQLVEGLPLGIELAAGWLEALSLEEVVEEIEKSLDFLETDLRDVPARHRSLRAVFESAWNVMNAAERDAFMKLAVFRGGFTREAAQKVTGVSLRDLTGLVNKSLVRRAADGRYTPHLLSRQYAEQQFEAFVEDKYAVQKEHAAYYADFMTHCENHFNSKREKNAVDMVDQELENIRLAWQWALSYNQWKLLDQMLHPLSYFYLVRSMMREGVVAFRELADVMQGQGERDSHLYWRARLRQVSLAGRLGDYELERRVASEALKYFQSAGDATECSFALNGLCYVNMMQGRYDDSLQTGRQALEMAKQANNAEMISLSMGNLGYAQFLVGQYEEAAATYKEFNHMAEENGSLISLAYGLNNMGEILRAQGQLEAAKKSVEEAYALFKSYNHRRGMAFSLNNLAGLEVLLGHAGEAKEAFRKTLAINKQIGDRPGIAHSLSALGNQAYGMHDYAEARRVYAESLKIRREMGDQRGIADSLNDLGDVAGAMQEWPEGLRFYEEALALRREINDRQGAVDLLIKQGHLLQKMKNVELATQRLNEAQQLAAALNNRGLVEKVAAALGDLMAAQKGREA